MNKINRRTLKKFLRRIPRWMMNRYFLVSLGALVWMIFFDHNNLWSQYKLWSELRDLKAKKISYDTKVQETEAEKASLMSSSAAMEKFAREHYFMKKDNEDLYVIVHSTKPTE